jgi:DNA-binding transcriptional regulator GbsR (MarR family)
MNESKDKERELKKIDKELENLLLKTNGDIYPSKVFNKMMFILLISEDEISMEKLAKKTKYSLASLSIAIKQAEKLDFVERIPHKGTKRVYVKAKDNFYNLVKKSIEKKHKKLIPQIKKLKEIEKKYKKQKLNVTKRIQFINDIERMEEKIKKINKILEED